jgi:hypothetical protein
LIQYAETHGDLADATLVALGEEQKDRRIFTLDLDSRCIESEDASASNWFHRSDLLRPIEVTPG